MMKESAIHKVTSTEKTTFRVELFNADTNEWELNIRAYTTLEDARARANDLLTYNFVTNFTKIRIVKRFEHIFDTDWEEADIPTRK